MFDLIYENKVIADNHLGQAPAACSNIEIGGGGSPHYPPVPCSKIYVGVA